MNIDQLREAINSLERDELQDFASEASLRLGVGKLIGKPVREHLLSAATTLIRERMVNLGLKPKARHQAKPEAIIHTIDRKQRVTEQSGKVVVTKVSPKEMEKLWQGLSQ